MIVFNRSNLGCFLLQYCAGTCLLDCWTSTKVLSSMTDCLNQYSFRTDWEKNSYTGILMTSSPAHFLLPVEIYCWASLVNISFQNCCLIFFSFCDFCLLKIFSIYFDTIIVFSFISLSIIYFSSLIILIVITFKSFHIKCNIFSQQYMLPFYDVWIIVCFFVFLTIFFLLETRHFRQYIVPIPSIGLPTLGLSIFDACLSSDRLACFSTFSSPHSIVLSFWCCSSGGSDVDLPQSQPVMRVASARCSVSFSDHT